MTRQHPRFSLLMGGLLALAALACRTAPAARSEAPQASCAEEGIAAALGGHDVLDYDAGLRIDPAEGTVRGTVTLLVRSAQARGRPLELAAMGLGIDGVHEGAAPLPFEHDGKTLRVSLPGPGEDGTPRRVEVRYHARPTKGLRFGAGTFHTAFHTEHWMPVRDVPGDKATLTLRLTVPAGLDVVATGRRVSHAPLPGGEAQHTWRLAVPHSAYLFGFAAGHFRAVHARAGATHLSFLADALGEAELRRLSADVEGMVRFFEARAGVPYPLEAYTQVLLTGAPAQELAGLSLLPASYAAEVLAEPREDWLVAHELAHAWWGNAVTCATWSDFWLNEGLTTFMVAAYKEHRWGRDESERERVLSRRRYARLRASGAERPLVLPEGAASLEAGGPLPYAKGSLVLHLLRFQLGEAAFWEGLRAFTTARAGCGATTRHLREAMERASGQDLGTFFAQWMHGTGVPEAVARHRVEGDALVLDVEQSGKAWTFPLEVAIETERGRQTHRVVLHQPHETFRFPLTGPLQAVRVDAGGHLPFTLPHERPVPMLLHQLVHEPDVQGRMEALEHLQSLCAAAPPECGQLPALLEARARSEPSRLMRKLLQDALTAAPSPVPGR
jgi:aminopeptidase N